MERINVVLEEDFEGIVWVRFNNLIMLIFVRIIDSVDFC